MKYILLSLLVPLVLSYGPETVKNFAGYIEIEKRGELFYWFFESRDDPSHDPLVLWFSGGPGCSSMLALFSENGPYVIGDDGEAALNAYSWNNNASVMWIDQPLGTGFSRGVPVHSEKGVAQDMLEFMQLFYTKYPKYAQLDLYIFGESYAGHYVPAIAAKLQQAKFTQLKGIGIGNGLTDPFTQYKYYAPYAEEHNLVSSTVLSFMQKMDTLCEPLINACNHDNNNVSTWSECLNAYVLCNLAEISPVQSTGINTYDVRKQCGDNPLCYNFTAIDTYLNRADVQQALNVSKKWNECSHLVDLVMVYGGDWMKDYASDVAFLLESNISTLIYNGEFDFMCNWMGSRAWTQSLQWYGQTDFQNATNVTFSIPNISSYAGSYISAHNFTFLKLKDAGHLAPHDQPQITLAMLRRFTLAPQGWAS